LVINLNKEHKIRKVAAVMLKEFASGIMACTNGIRRFLNGNTDLFFLSKSRKFQVIYQFVNGFQVEISI
jgi:hypothetical protein